MNQAKLRGYRRLLDAGRRDLSEVPEPYYSALKDEGYEENEDA